ncbi:MAG TPA: hypothetical protein VEW07_07930 [Solirubrobacterales bacterium]|nr:hypothetical protein [Solirubrobacterales bacterium]
MVGGCGDSGDEALSKGAFIAQAQAICDKADDRQSSGYKAFLKENGKDESKAREEELVVEVGIPPIEVEIEELRELGAPDGDEDEIAAMLDGVEKAVEESKKDPLSVYTAKTPFKAVEDQAAKYGLKKCGFT